MELFSEIYGCYFTLVAQILKQAQNGLSKIEIEKLVTGHGFYDTAFHLLPSLFSGEWSLLTERDNKYFSKFTGETKRPLTTLEKSWLKTLLSDPRIKLFLNDSQLRALNASLNNIEPLYEQNDFHIYDKHLDGDDYNDDGYIARFKAIAGACKAHQPIIIEYDSSKGGRTKRQYHPYKICYSARDDKFRLLCAAFNRHHNKFERITLNLGRIKSVLLSENQLDISVDLDALYKEPFCNEPVVLEISKERNALERCMLQFASFERQTEYDKERDIYTCRINFDPSDETELLIRILSFGPVVKVLGPENFLSQVKERISRQLKLQSGEFISIKNI